MTFWNTQLQIEISNTSAYFFILFHSQSITHKTIICVLSVHCLPYSQILSVYQIVLLWILFPFMKIQKQPPEVFYKKRCSYRNFAKFTGKHLCQSLFFNKLAGLRPANLLKKKLWHNCEFCKKILSTFFTEQLWTTASEYILDVAIQVKTK